MNSLPSPYLKVARLQSTQRGISSTSSCSTLTHSTGPMPSGKSNTSGSLNGGVVNQPAVLLPDHRRVEALLDRGPDRERRREVVARDLEVGAVAGAELVDLGEQVVGGVAGEHVGEPGLDAHPDQREPAGRSHSSATANCSSPSLTPASAYGSSGCGWTGSSPCRGSRPRRRTRPSKIGITNRGSTAFITWVMPCSRTSASTEAASEASTCAATNRSSSSALDRHAAPGLVVVGHDAALEEVAPRGDGGERRADAAGADQQDPHVVYSPM